MMLRVEVVAHDPAWRERYAAEAKRISAALPGVPIQLHHVGSTAIPNIHAKPIIDILMEVVDLRTIDDHTAAMEMLGYEALGEFGIPERRYFRRDDSTGTRTHQVHAFVAGTAAAVRHLAFRDYMAAHPAAARAYGELKQRLALSHPNDIVAYMAGKDSFIKEHEAQALVWRAGMSKRPTESCVS